MPHDAETPRVRSLWERFRQLAPSKRAAFLERECASPRERTVLLEMLEEAVAAATEDFVGGETESPRVPLPVEGTMDEGAAIGRYTLGSVLGRGGFGVVYRATDDRGRVVALKTVRVPRAGFLHSIRREIQALSRLSHPGIVPILDHGLHEGLPWYAMKLVEGAPLAGPTIPDDGSRYRHAESELRRIVTLFRRLCSPLAYLHGEGLVHRDLKPQNVLVGDDAVPIVMDFGLISQSRRETSREALEVGGRSSGTLLYMSPEQSRGDVVDARSDLYSLGCMLWEALVGRPPFLGGAAAVRRGHLLEPPEPPSRLVDGIPPALDGLVLRLLAKEPRERMGYASDVAGVLAEVGGADGAYRGAPSPQAYLNRPGFAGRRDELHRLAGVLGRLKAGAGSLLLIGGESGVGKTRLVTEMARQARAAGCEILTGECPSDGGAVLQALRRPLRDIADRCRELGESETERLVGSRGPVLATYEPSLSGLPGQAELDPPPVLAPEASRLRVFGNLADTLAEFAADRGAVVILDDLHWADESTVAFLRFLLESARLDRSRLVILGTYRAEEMGRRLDALIDRPEVAAMRLGPLSRDGVQRMAADMLSLEESPPELTSFLHRSSAGNPFFVAEYLRVAMARGVLVRDPRGRWQVEAKGVGRSYDDLPLPGSLRELVARRIDGVTPRAREVLHAAAVMGKEISIPVLLQATGIEEAQLLDALQELIRVEILAELGPTVGFSHDQMRDAAAKRTPNPSRLHGAIARALEELHPDDLERRAAELAHHWLAAGDRAAACGYLAIAGQRAQACYALEEAERHYRAYLDALTEPSSESLRIRDRLGNMLTMAGRLDESEAQHRAGIEEARRLGALKEEADHLHSLTMVLENTGRADQAASYLEQARRLHRQAADARGEATDMAALASQRFRAGDAEGAASLIREALEVVSGRGSSVEAQLLSNLAIIVSHQGRRPEAQALYERALGIYRELGSERLEGAVLCNLATLFAGDGDLDRAQGLYEQALHIHQRARDRRGEGLLLVNLAELLSQRGRVVEAHELARRAVQLHRDVADRRGEARALTHLVELELFVGDAARADGQAMEAAALSRELRDRAEQGKALCARGHVVLASGRSAEAVLEEVRQLVGETRPGPRAQLVERLARLERAQSHWVSGGSLMAGQHPDDLTDALKDWFRTRAE